MPTHPEPPSRRPVLFAYDGSELARNRDQAGSPRTHTRPRRHRPLRLATCRRRIHPHRRTTPRRPRRNQSATSGRQSRRPRSLTRRTSRIPSPKPHDQRRPNLERDRRSRTRPPRHPDRARHPPPHRHHRTPARKRHRRRHQPLKGVRTRRSPTALNAHCGASRRLPGSVRQGSLSLRTTGQHSSGSPNERSPPLHTMDRRGRRSFLVAGPQASGKCHRWSAHPNSTTSRLPTTEGRATEDVVIRNHHRETLTEMRGAERVARRSASVQKFRAVRATGADQRCRGGRRVRRRAAVRTPRLHSATREGGRHRRLQRPSVGVETRRVCSGNELPLRSSRTRPAPPTCHRFPSRGGFRSYLLREKR